MNLRLPVIAGIVLVAGAAAGMRALRPEPPPSAPAAAGFESADAGLTPAPPSRASERHRHRLRAQRGAAPGGQVVVYVAGEVVRRGVYSLPASARAVDALAKAGGAAPDADLVAVNLAAPLSDGEEIAVPAKGAALPSAGGRRASASASPRGPRSRRKRRSPAANAVDDVPAVLVDLNLADENELETLPGIGPALADRIVVFRETNGPFGSLDDLLDVGGMTQRKLDDLEPYAVVH